ncbi:hypothetical protein C1X65_16490 [Pseudomonas sp. FW305-70]|nr:hypothetical protein C1X65_16490 [Pseudomonas sp. FW305-70]
MAGLQNVDGRVHDDLLWLFLCVSSGNSLVIVRPPSRASPLPQGECIPNVGAGLLAKRPAATPQISRQMRWAASHSTRNK